MQTRRILAVATALLIGGGALVARTQSPQSRNDMASAATAAERASLDADARGFAGANAGGGVAADAAAPTPPQQAARVPDAQPRVVKTAQLEVTTDADTAVTKATERAGSVAAAHGGFVASTEAQRGTNRFTSLTLRVPAAAFDAALKELRRLGEVTNESLGGEDVTSALVDLDARLRTLRAQEAALNALVGRANTVGETLEVAREAATVRTQIEQLAAQQAQLSDQADFATITLRILGPHATVDGESPQPLLVGSFEQALGGSLAVLGGVLVLLGYLVPLALVAAGGYGIWRLARRRPAVA